jgi:broad specificity phosphatase PhoE
LGKPDLLRIYGQSDVDCDVSSAEVSSSRRQRTSFRATPCGSRATLRLRTRQTAAAILAAMISPRGAGGVPEFAEQHLGDCGQVRADFAARDRARYPSWFGPADERAPGRKLVDACKRAWRRTIERLNGE